MNRRTLLIASASLVLGIVLGGSAVYAFATNTSASPVGAVPPTPTAWSTKAAVFGEQLNLDDLLTAAKPRDAKFIASPGGAMGLTRYGYDGYRLAVWEGPTNPEAVKDIVFKDLEARFRAKKWETERGSAMNTGSGKEFTLAAYELRYHLPDYSAAGWVQLFIHQEGKRVGVVLVFNTGRDWPTE